MSASDRGANEHETDKAPDVDRIVAGRNRMLAEQKRIEDLSRESNRFFEELRDWHKEDWCERLERIAHEIQEPTSSPHPARLTKSRAVAINVAPYAVAGGPTFIRRYIRPSSVPGRLLEEIKAFMDASPSPQAGAEGEEQ